MAKGQKTGGRTKGTPNKTTALLKDAILLAAENVGNELDPDKGLVAYLEKQAKQNPKAFMTLLGKILPMQIAGDTDNPVTFVYKTNYEPKPDE